MTDEQIDRGIEWIKEKRQGTECWDDLGLFIIDLLKAMRGEHGR